MIRGAIRIALITAPLEVRLHLRLENRMHGPAVLHGLGHRTHIRMAGRPLTDTQVTERLVEASPDRPVFETCQVAIKSC
jgi:hypothetical protein